MERRHRPYGPHAPPGEEPAGWVVAGEEQDGRLPHQRDGWDEPDRPPAGHRYEPEGWYAQPSGPEYGGAGHHEPPEPGDPAAGRASGYLPPDPAGDYRPRSYPPGPHRPADPGHPYRPDDTHAGSPYLPRAHAADPSYGSDPGPWSDPAHAADPSYRTAPGHRADHTTDPGHRAAHRPDPTYPPQPPPAYPPRRAAVPGRSPADDPPTASWASALLWTVGLFVVPALVYLGWALTLSGVAPAGCVEAAGAACPPPRSAAVGQLVDAVPALGGALALALLVALGVRRIATDWRAVTVGLAAAVIGAGLATLVAAIVG